MIARLAALPALALAACALAAAGCERPAPGRIVVAAKEIPSRLDPVRASNPAEENACELVFDGMVNIAANDSGTASPVLGLAESIAQDQFERNLYIINLRDARWQDGKALDSNDVVASFNAYTDPANRSPRREYLLALIDRVDPDGPRRVFVRFKEPIAEFRAWYVLAFKIVPRSYRGVTLPSNRNGAAGDAFAAAPIGTGPFRFKSRLRDEILFVANETCYRGAPAAESFALRRVENPEERIEALLKGRVDVIADTSPLDRPRLERAGDVMVQSYMPHAFYSAAINLRKPALAGLDARRALVRAVDRPALVPGLTDQGTSVELNYGPFPDGLLTKVLPEYFKQGFPDRQRFDARAAARLAVSSGLASAGREPLKVIAPASWGEFGSRLASALASHFSRASVLAEGAILEDEAYRSALAGRDFDLALVYHEGYDNLFSGISELYRSGSPQNETGVSDPRLDRLLEDRDKAIEATAWLADTLALHDLVSELVPYIPLFTLEKDLFYRGVSGLLIASDNPYLTAEKWAKVPKQ